LPGIHEAKKKGIEHGRRKGKMSSSENDTKKAGFWESLASSAEDEKVTLAAQHQYSNIVNAIRAFL
jgi:hypothetical protein